ncbi:MAG TPA: SAM-dependent methyltransferase [Flavobacteriaceae bacterium]|nr:MAG: Putative O-methyltransferase/MSMEI_4947 [Flavobacteriaceae bacterium]HCQ24882.1 SAM-dependent methyltransferase [Flavobacteriaceae bacterium]|tara:strand:+ start:12216 stop:12794 length:579 start_codon:yes stop_codon:yes gene_type:complete
MYSQKLPAIYNTLIEKSQEIGFTMPSDILVGSLLKTLIASKPSSHILELGTGIGLSLSWMIEGLDKDSKIISIDNDSTLITIVKSFFGDDPRIKLVCEDGSKWISNYQGVGFDLVFADAWPGKFSDLDQLLVHIKIGGFYVIDDINPQSNWPEGHQEKVEKLIHFLESKQDFSMTKIDWSTGVIIMTKLKTG